MFKTFWLIYVKNLKILFKSGDLIFWMLIFPLALSTLFYAAFSNLGKEEIFSEIPVAVIAEQENPVFEGALAEVSDEGGLFSVREMTLAEADEALSQGEVKAAIVVGAGSVSLRVASSGMEQTIVRTFLDEYTAVMASVGGIAGENPGAIAQAVKDLTARTGNLGENAAAGRNMSENVTYYYALLGMTCFYFAMAGINVMESTQANQSRAAARLNVSSVKRSALFAGTLCATITVLLIVMAVVMLYIAGVLGVEFGTRIGLVALTCLAGTLTGTSLGLFIGGFKLKQPIKVAVVVALTMFCAFFAGLMSPQVKYSVMALRYINPLGLITDCFYALYYYQDLSQFALSIGLLAAFTVVFIAAALLLIRRKRYASI